MVWLFTVVTERMLISNIDLWLIANSAPNQKTKPRNIHITNHHILTVSLRSLDLTLTIKHLNERFP